LIKAKIAELKPEMVIARDVTDLSGCVLLPAGVKITAKHLKIFKIWGIPDICIEGGTETAMTKTAIEGENSAQLEKIKEELKTLFCHNDLNHPVIQELFNICIERKLNASLQSQGK